MYKWKVYQKEEEPHGKFLILSFSDAEGEALLKTLEMLNIKEGGDLVYTEKNVKTQNLDIDVTRRIVFHHNSEINLTFTEFEILHLLARNPGRVFSKEQIYDMVWKESYRGDCNIVMNHIQKIRKKIEDEPSQPLYIQTVWGVGYRFNPNMGSDM